jgi:O-antigen ligase
MDQRPAPEVPAASPFEGAGYDVTRRRGGESKAGYTLVSRLFSTQATIVAGGLGAGLLMATAGVGIGWAAVFGLAFFAYSLRSIRPALLLSVAIMMVFGREELYQYDIPLGGGGLKISDLLLCVTLGAWLIRVVVFRKTVLRLPRLFSTLVLLFLLVSVVSAIGAVTSNIYYKDALLELRPLLQYLLVFPLMAEFDTHKLYQGIWFLLCVSVVSSIRILVNYWMGAGQVLLFGEGIRVVLLELGAYLPPVILGFTFSMFRIKPKLTLGIGLLNLAALAVTFFRSAYLGLSSGMFFLFMTAEPVIRRTMVRLAFFLVAGGVVLGFGLAYLRPTAVNPVESVVTRFLSLREFEEDISSLHRLREWEAAAVLIENKPIWGNGLGARVVFESPMYDPEEKRLGYLSHDMYMHNSYMWLLVKMGVVGLMSFLLLPLMALFTVLRTRGELVDKRNRATLLAMGGVLTGNMVISVFGPMFNIDNMTPINAFVLGSVFILAREAGNPWENGI